MSNTEDHDKTIKNIYNIFVRCNSKKHNISIDSILDNIKLYNQSLNYFLPEHDINDFEEGDMVQGRDFCMYVVNSNKNNIKYWHKSHY